MTPNDLKRFWKEKYGNKANCGCGENNWRIPRAEAMLIPIPIVPDTDNWDQSAKGYFPVYPVWCWSCGDVRWIARSAILRWADGEEDDVENNKDSAD